MTRSSLTTAIIALLLAIATAAPAGQPLPTPQELEDGAWLHQSPGPQGPEDGAWRRQLWFIPLPGERLLMHAIVLRPQGPGPFPLVVINHGSIQSEAVRARYRMHEYPIASHWFLNRGFAVVLPLRGGHGETGGPYFEDQGRCENADFHRAGLRTAYSIEAAIDYMTAQPFADKTGVIVVGQSAGAWGALALASRNPAKVAAVINFAGGRGGHAGNVANNNCSPDRLVAAAEQFGRTARIPTLWVYAENDSYFAPALSKRMHAAYRGAGGRVDFHLLPPLAGGGHGLIDSKDAAQLWTPIVERFLFSHGQIKPVRSKPAG